MGIDIEESKPNPKAGAYARQIPLLDTIAEGQKNCPHTLKLIQQTIICIECNAIWIK